MKSTADHLTTEEMCQQFFAPGTFDFMVYGKLPGSTKTVHLANFHEPSKTIEYVTQAQAWGIQYSHIIQDEIVDHTGPFDGHRLGFETRRNDDGTFDKFFNLEEVQEFKRFQDQLDSAGHKGQA